MFLHIDTKEYQYARVGIAICDKVAGPCKYIGSISPHNSDSRDMIVFSSVNYLRIKTGKHIYSIHKNGMQLCILVN